MLARIIFCVVIAVAVLTVVLLATVSPIPHRSGGGHKHGPPGQRTFMVYIHPTAVSTSVPRQQQHQQREGEASALVFRHRMTVGPESTSGTIGAASGFLLPSGVGGEVTSVFNTVHLEFDNAAGPLSGSLCVEANNEKEGGEGKRERGGKEEKEVVLRVVGGTGAFAFARGHAVVRAQRLGHGATAAPLQLELSVSPAVR